MDRHAQDAVGAALMDQEVAVAGGAHVADLAGEVGHQFVAKVGHLKNGGGLNGGVRLNAFTLAADGQDDQIHPNASPTADDLFVVDAQDQFSAANLPSSIENQQKIVV